MSASGSGRDVLIELSGSTVERLLVRVRSSERVPEPIGSDAGS